MSLTLDKAPYISVYNNLLNIFFNDFTGVQSEFDFVNNKPFFLIVDLQKLNDDSNIIFKGLIDDGSDPSDESEGLNQLNLSIPLDNGVYKINNIEISLNGSIEDLITVDDLYYPNYHVPSINENLLKIL